MEISVKCFSILQPLLGPSLSLANVYNSLTQPQFPQLTIGIIVVITCLMVHVYVCVQVREIGSPMSDLLVRDLKAQPHLCHIPKHVLQPYTHMFICNMEPNIRPVYRLLFSIIVVSMFSCMKFVSI